MTTSPKLPEGLEPVAWESTTICYTKFVSDRRYQKFSPKVQAWYKPYRCSSCESLHASPLAKEVECEALRKDAERWRYIRHHWSNAQMHWNKDATNSLKSIVLTIKTAHWTSGADEIDSAIDAALVAAKGNS